MTGLEVIGAIASIAQVAQYTCSIIASMNRVYGTLEAAPGKLRSGCEQLQKLSETVAFIQCNKALQTQHVLAQAGTITEQIILLDKMLKNMLLQTKKPWIKKVARAYLGDQSEARLMEAFAQLEMKKSALGLSVLEVNMRMTSSILNKVDALKQTDVCGSLPVTPTSDDSDLSGSTLRGSELDEMPCRPRQRYRYVYKNVKSTGGAFQVNGNIGESTLIDFENHYTDIIASENSTQLNGHISSTILFSLFSRRKNDKR